MQFFSILFLLLIVFTADVVTKWSAHVRLSRILLRNAMAAAAVKKIHNHIEAKLGNSTRGHEYDKG
jgi:hypothetical protein